MDITTKYGTLIRWISERNYGFIREDESGSDVFCHSSCFVAKIAPPKNSRCKFHLAPNPKNKGGIMAADIEVLAAPVSSGGAR
jgi:cold shock CspA family protein